MKRVKGLDKPFIDLLEKYNFLNSIIKGELLEELLEDIDITVDERESIKNFIKQRNNLSTEEEYVEWIKNSGTTEEELFRQLQKSIKIKKYIKDKYSHQIHARFLQRKNQLEKVVYSLIRVKDPYLSQEIFLRLRDGEEFGNLAQEFSEGPEQLTRGIVGPVPIEQSSLALSKLLRSCKAHEINPPFQVEGYWIIVRLESLIEAVLTEDLEEMMSKELLEKDLHEESQVFIKKLKLSFDLPKQENLIHNN